MIWEDYVILAASIITIFIMIVTLILTIIRRKNPIIKVLIPWNNFGIGIGYLIYLPAQTVSFIEEDKKKNCLFISVLPVYLLLYLLFTCYIIKSLHIYIMTTRAKEAIRHYNKKNLPSDTEMIFLKDNSDSSSFDQIEDLDSKLCGKEVSYGCCFSKIASPIDLYIYKKRGFSTSFFFKIFLASTIVTIIFISISIAVEPRFQTLEATSDCGDNILRYIIIALAVLAFIIIYLFLILRLWNVDDCYGFKTQLKGSLVGWIFIFVFSFIFIGLNDSIEPHFKVWGLLSKVFSLAGLLVPFYFDCLHAVIMSFKKHEKYTADDEENPNYIDHTIESVVRNNQGIVAFQQFLSYHDFSKEMSNEYQHYVFFLRDFLKFSKALFKNGYNDDTIIKRSDLDPELKELLQKFAGGALFLYFKYFHPEAIFPIITIFNEKRSMKLKKLSVTYSENSVAYKDRDICTFWNSMRFVYDKIIENLEPRFEEFKNDPKFYYFVEDAIKRGTISTILSMSTSAKE